MKTVFEYFEECFGCEPSDITLCDLPVDSGCGTDCVEAINAARSLFKVANITDPRLGSEVLKVVEHVVSTLWRG